MNKLKYYILILLIQFSVKQNILGQIVSGKVISESLKPLIGVSIFIPNTNTGVITDFQGDYLIKIDSNYNTIRFCYVAYESQEITINRDTILNITLKESPIELDGIIIYGPRIEIRKRCHAQLKKIEKKRWFHKPDTIIIGLPDSTFNRIETERIRNIKDSINTYIAPKVIPKLNDSINFTKEPPNTKFSIVERTFRKYIVDYIKYPEKVVNSNIEGTVYAKFTINEESKILDIKILRNVTPELDNEVIYILEHMPEELQKEFGEMGYYYERRKCHKYIVKIAFRLIDML